MTEALVTRIETARMFRDTLAAIPVVEDSSWGSPELAARCEAALVSNKQVSGAYQARAAITALAEKWRAA